MPHRGSQGFDAVEVWNGLWTSRPWNAGDQAALAEWGRPGLEPPQCSKIICEVAADQAAASGSDTQGVSGQFKIRCRLGPDNASALADPVIQVRVGLQPVLRRVPALSRQQVAVRTRLHQAALVQHQNQVGA